MIYQMIYSLLSLCMLPTELSDSYRIFNTYKLYVGLQGTILLSSQTKHDCFTYNFYRKCL